MVLTRETRFAAAASDRPSGESRIVYRDGVPLAVLEGDVVRELAAIDPSIAADVSRALRPRRAAAMLV